MNESKTPFTDQESADYDIPDSEDSDGTVLHSVTYIARYTLDFLFKTKNFIAICRRRITGKRCAGGVDRPAGK